MDFRSLYRHHYVVHRGTNYPSLPETMRFHINQQLIDLLGRPTLVVHETLDKDGKDFHDTRDKFIAEEAKRILVYPLNGSWRLYKLDQFEEKYGVTSAHFTSSSDYPVYPIQAQG